MSAPVAFNYDMWVTRYPEFSAVPQPQAQAYFDEATLYWRNDGTSLCSATVTQSLLLNMLTAFVAQQYAQADGSTDPGGAKPSDTPVGRISSATEGSVSVSLENLYPPGSVQFFQQNKYGASFWQATAVYRTMRYARGFLQPGGLGPAGFGVGFGPGFVPGWCQ